MKNLNLALIALLMTISISVFSQITGTVYRDYNENGVRNTSATYNEGGVAGVTVTCIDALGNTGSTITSSTGTYSLTGCTGQTRVEFIWPLEGDYSAPNGTGNKTSVQFITAPASSINFGINYPNEYYQPNPIVTVPSIHSGDPLGGGNSGTGDALYGFNYDDFNLPADINNPAPDVLVQNITIGTTWGAAFDRNTQYLYVSAALKRHAGFGPMGPGGIYRIDMTNPASPTVLNWFTVPNAGTDPRIVTPLPPGLFNPSRDSMAYKLAGKMSLGGMDLSDDGSLLYVMNLNTRAIDVINVSTAALSTSIPISISGISDIRPWGVKYYRGDVYAMVVDPKEGTGAVPTGYILKYSGGSWSTLFQFSFSYTRDKVAGSGSSCPGTWNDWDSNPANFPAGGCSSGNAAHIFYPQPILSDIEFDQDGSLILGVIDRFNLMSGHLNYQPTGSSTSTYSGVTSGDILRICNNGGTFNQENFGICTYPQTGENEWYAGETFSEVTYSPTTYSHGEISMGALAILPGTGEVVVTAMDPINGTTSSFGTGGVRYLSNSGANAGLTNKAYKLYGSGSGISKAYGLGDIEFVTDPPPIEIGNRIWIDTDSDGVQDPEEAPIAGVTVQLVNSSGTVIATAVTNSTGNYYFTNAAGTTTSSSIYNIAQLLPDMEYKVRIPNISGTSKQAALGSYRLTTQNAFNGVPLTQEDVRDSDGSIVGTSAEALVLTTDIPLAGANNHTFDFGFSTLPPCTLTLSNVQVSSCTCTSTAGYMDPTGLTNLLSGGTFGTSGTYNNVPIPGQGTVDILYSYNGTGNTLTPDFRYLDVANGLPISTDFSSLGITGTVVPGIRNKVNTGNTGVLNFSFDQPTSNINLFVFDVDWDDQVTVTAWDAYGNPITNFSGWTVITGDLTAPIDAPNAIWNPTTHTISSSSNVNGERNFTSLEPDVAVSKVVFSFTGTTDPNSNAPHTQYAIYSNLNASTCTATVTADVSWTNAPSGQNINVTSGGFSKVINVAGGATSPQTVSFTIVPDGTTHPITAVFDGDPTCTDTENYTAPANCSPACNLTSAGLTNVQCNSSSTPATSTDDYITFSLNPSGTLLGSTYTVSSNNGGILTPTSASYGVTTNFRLQNGSANGSTIYTITITDSSGPPCQISVDVGPVSPCSACPDPNCKSVSVLKN